MKVTVAAQTSFLKRLRNLPPSRQESAKRALIKFQQEPGLNSLKFRALKGAPDHFIINSGEGDRIILRKERERVYSAVDVGVHDIYRRWNR